MATLVHWIWIQICSSRYAECMFTLLDTLPGTAECCTFDQILILRITICSLCDCGEFVCLFSRHGKYDHALFILQIIYYIHKANRNRSCGILHHRHIIIIINSTGIGINNRAQEFGTPYIISQKSI